MQVTQQVFMAKECVRGAHNKFEAESNLQHKVERAIRSTREEKNQLAEKLSMKVKAPWQGLRMPRLKPRTNARFSSPRS